MSKGYTYGRVEEYNIFSLETINHACYTEDVLFRLHVSTNNQCADQYQAVDVACIIKIKQNEHT